MPKDDGGTVAVVDDVAHQVWELCDGTRTPDQIKDQVSQSIGYPISEVAEFVEQLRRVGLITLLE
ncbi:PqqD family peptide modification chaperone [Nocardia sp. SYP-A9097]|uniref:PqqD family protein n=1 Tax=Nocardia sp. SYP-A9097 TaxID=2663237 RepID=UPI00129A3478|nr:PqqD family protein [Nocardia sp. SYP-A9097]MRH93338.1 PqqD family peptide modification chaperone [Nocardia sp. SYP-A9097]